ncbi:MAG TPA: biotin carboxylase N-terminal domain-containing protein, partial [Anaerolineales bacterium]
MFKKILIANRGEIAVRVLQACRELGVPSLALYQAPDIGSLHVRLADECVRLDSPDGFMDQEAIVQIARRMGADAIHPGYGFLAEHPEFIQAVEAAGIRFIGPPVEVVSATRDKLGALRKARQAGFATVEFSQESYCEADCANQAGASALRAEAGRLGYPLVIKSCSGGRGLGEQLVRSPDELEKAVQRAQAEAQIVFSDRKVYLEKALFPAQQVSVQVLGDGFGELVHLG